MDKKIFYLLIIIIIIIPIYALITKNTIFPLSFIVLIVGVPILCMLSEKFSTRKVNFDEFYIILDNEFKGKWKEKPSTKFIDSIDKDVPATFYTANHSGTKRLYGGSARSSIMQYDYYEDVKFSNEETLVLLRFDNIQDANLAKENLMNHFSIKNENRYITNGNKVLIYWTGNYIKEIRFKN